MDNYFPRSYIEPKKGNSIALGLTFPSQTKSARDVSSEISGLNLSLIAFSLRSKRLVINLVFFIKRLKPNHYIF
jgi:hypothetical protein